MKLVPQFVVKLCNDIKYLNGPKTSNKIFTH